MAGPIPDYDVVKCFSSLLVPNYRRFCIDRKGDVSGLSYRLRWIQGLILQLGRSQAGHDERKLCAILSRILAPDLRPPRLRVWHLVATFLPISPGRG